MANPVAAVVEFGAELEAWKPMDTDAPAARVGAQEGAFAVACCPLWVMVAFQPLVIWVPEGMVQPSVQSLSGELPVFLSVTFAVKPLDHALSTWYVTAHDVEGDGPGPGPGSLPAVTSAEKELTARPTPPLQGSNPAWMLVRYQERSTRVRLSTSLTKSMTLNDQLAMGVWAT